jgi:hypothetical protein
MRSLVAEEVEEEEEEEADVAAEAEGTPEEGCPKFMMHSAYSASDNGSQLNN